MQSLPVTYQSEGFSENSEYSDGPLNNFKWARVSETIGECWYGRSVYNLQKILARRYEFVRGEVPEEHQWNRQFLLYKIFCCILYEYETKKYLIMTVDKMMEKLKLLQDKGFGSMTLFASNYYK